MSYYWTTKMNDATNRRIDKLMSEGVKIDTATHEGRKTIGPSAHPHITGISPTDVHPPPSHS